MNQISIIVPIYHGKEYIPQLIKQAENCSLRLDRSFSVELVLVNDAPDDRLDESISSAVIDVLVINRTVNRGIQGARIKGIEYSSGEYILLLDQDDIIYPECLKSQIDKMQGYDAVVCRLRHEDRQFYNLTRPFEQMIGWEHILKKGNPIISPGQVLMKKEAVPECWKKNILTHNGADDWFLWICMFKSNCRVALNDEVLFEHVVNGRNVSSNALEMAESENEMLDVLRKQGILKKEEAAELEHTIKGMVAERLRLLEKYCRESFVYDEWMSLKIRGIGISEFLSDRGYRTVSIYGVTRLGRRLGEDLVKDGIDVRYFIDINAEYLDEKLPVYSPEDNLMRVDLIIISLVINEESVKKCITEKHGMRVYTILELLYEIQKNTL